MCGPRPSHPTRRPQPSSSIPPGQNPRPQNKFHWYSTNFVRKMISSLQPTRPKHPGSIPTFTPASCTMPPTKPSLLNQQPARAISITSVPAVPYSPIRAVCTPDAKPRPRTQIEALPPQYDPSVRHPVFFTKTLQKPPSGVGAGNSVSPVAMGYVENSIKNHGMNVKL